MGDGKKGITLISQPQAYFHELVTATLGKQQIPTKPETEFYLVNLLNQFMTADRLYATKENGERREEPLVLMIKEALEQREVEAQSAIFRQVGDFSLYVGGFFQDSLSRKLVDVDYYIEMGRSAYNEVAVRTGEHALQAVYGELAQKFDRFIEVLAEISDNTSQRTEKDILRLYELWVRTKSERAAKALQEAGIIPNDTIKKDWQ